MTPRTGWSESFRCGYPAVWLQSATHGGLVIALGVVLLIIAAVVVLRPDKRTEPPDSTGPVDSDAHEAVAV